MTIEGGARRIRSLTALDGEKVGAEIRRRLELYRRGIWVFAVLAALCLFLGAMMYLPPAAENTAFENIAVSSASRAWAQLAGLTVIKGPPLVGEVFLRLLLPAVLLIAIVAILARRYVGFLVFPLIAFFFYWQLGSLFFIDHSELEIARAQLTPALAASLEQKAKGVTGTDKGTSAGGAVSSKTAPSTRSVAGHAVGPDTARADADISTQSNKLVYPGWQSSTGSPLRNLISADPLSHLSSADAAYLLAQAAYIDGRMEDTAEYLQAASSAMKRLGVAHQQRFDIMREWVEARGSEMNIKTDLRRLIVPMAIARSAATPMIFLGIAFAVLGAAMIALFLIGNHRVTRITRLVADVHAMRAASGASART